VLDLDDELGLLDGLDAGFPELEREVTTASPRKRVLARSPGIELGCRRPEQAERTPALVEVPHTRRHDAARLDHTTHLAKSGHRVGHEVHDQLGERSVEHVIRKRKLLGAGAMHFNSGMSLADGFHERRRRIESQRRVRLLLGSSRTAGRSRRR
jgi:hypothetical protein